MNISSKILLLCISCCFYPKRLPKCVHKFNLRKKKKRMLGSEIYQGSESLTQTLFAWFATFCQSDLVKFSKMQCNAIPPLTPTQFTLRGSLCFMLYKHSPLPLPICTVLHQMQNILMQVVSVFTRLNTVNCKLVSMHSTESYCKKRSSYTQDNQS